MMAMHEQGSTVTCQRGAILVTALIFLAVITMLGVTSMRSSTIGVRMAHNEESRFTAMETAQAISEAIVSTPAAAPVIGDPGFTICTAGEMGCDLYGVPLPAGYVGNSVAAGHLSARVERMAPSEKPPPRGLESSLDKFSTASFRVISTYDRGDEGLGRAQLVEGVLVLVPRF
jgi:hypothetical protein